LNAIGAASGIGSFQVATALSSQIWADATTSVDREYALYTPGTYEYNYYFEKAPTLTIGQLFKNSSSTKAQAGLPGSLLPNHIYFDPKYVSDLSTANAAAMLLHETFHNLGTVDSVLMRALGYDPDGPSGKITDRLWNDCFGHK
jgi:hypothetical protein